MLGAALKSGAGPAQATLGIHVKAGGRFLDQLTKGPDALVMYAASRATFPLASSSAPT